AERVGTAGKYQVRVASADIAVAGVDRLHAGAAVDLYRERGHRLAHAETQRRDPRRVHLLGGDADAAEDDLIEGVGRKRLAPQQRPPAGDPDIHPGGPPRPPPAPDERPAAPRAADTPP